MSRAGVAFEREKQQLLQQQQVSPNTLSIAEIFDAKDRQLLKATSFQLSPSEAMRRSSLLQQSQSHSDPIILTLLTINTDKEAMDSANADGRFASPDSLPDARKALKSLSESELNLPL